MTTREESVSAEEYARVHEYYWRVVRESEGFDLEDVSIPSYMCGTPILVMRTFQCHNNGRYPYCDLVKGYGMVGLQRYNMIQGTNYRLCSLLKFNMTTNFVGSYYLTLLAQDPDVSPTTFKTFQVRIDEKSGGRLDFTCSVARLKEEAKGEGEPFIPHYHGGGPEATVPFVGDLPPWPSDADLNDESRFYMVNRSEWEATDWIFMYLVLVIYSHDRLIVTRDSDYQSKLKIVSVIIETRADGSDSEPSKERLKAKSAHVYITFKGLTEPQAPRQSFEVGEHVERRAIVRRVICESTGEMSLLGKLCGGKFTGKQCFVTRGSGEEAHSSKRARTRRRS